VIRCGPVLALMAAWLSVAVPAFATAESDADHDPPSAMVSAAVLEARIAEVGDAKDVTDEARDRLLGLYRQSISNLEVARANELAAAGYRQSGENAPGQIESMRAALAETLADDPLAQLDMADDVSLTDLEPSLQKERADLAAVKARHDDLKAQLAAQERRPAVIRQRLVEANAERESVAVALQSDASESGAPGQHGLKLAEARRWELETRNRALSTEIKMLDQELLSRAARLDLLEAKRDKDAASIDWIAARVAALEARTLTQRRQAAAQARADAERTRRDVEGMDPVLVRWSEDSVELGQAINELVAELDGLDEDRARVERLTERLEADNRDTRNTLESGEFSAELGAILLRQLEAMPDLNSLRQQQAQRRAQLASENTRRLAHRTEARGLTDVEAAVSELQSQLQPGQPPAEQDRLQALVTQRLELLDHILETQELYFSKAGALDAAEDALLAVAGDYEALLLGRLAWLRTEAPIDVHRLLALPEQVGRLLAGERTVELGRIVSRQLGANPLFWGALVLVGALLWSRRRIRVVIERLAVRSASPPRTASASRCGRSALTLLLALPLPLLLGAHRLAAGARIGDRSGAGRGRGVAQRSPQLLLTLALLSAVCRPHGLAAAHFRWPEPNLRLLRTATRRLTWLLIPALLLMHLARLDPLESGGTLRAARRHRCLRRGRLVPGPVFHPRRGVMAQLRHPGCLSDADGQLLALVSGAGALPGRADHHGAVRLSVHGVRGANNYTGLAAAALRVGAAGGPGPALAARGAPTNLLRGGPGAAPGGPEGHPIRAAPAREPAARPRSRISRSPRWTSRHSATTPAG
jgi:potassium efflux system protein